MIDFRLQDGRIVFSDGLLQYVDGAERVRQQLELRLSLWRGEWFLDGEFGMPWVESVLGKQLSITGALAAMRKEILAVEGVNKLEDFSWRFDRQARRLYVEFTAHTDYGLITFP